MQKSKSGDRPIQIEAFVNSGEANKLSVGDSIEIRLVGPLQEPLPPVFGRLVSMSSAEGGNVQGQVGLEIELSIESLSLIGDDLRQTYDSPHDCSIRVQGSGSIILGHLAYLPGNVPMDASH